MVSRSRLKALSLGALGLVALLALMLSAQVGPFATGHGANAQGGEELVGTFQIDPGQCDPGGPVTSGSYFQMIQSGGDLETGPFIANVNSPCDSSYTLLSPGGQGRLITGDFQPNPDPAFDPVNSDGLASQVTQPQVFLAVDFAISTNQTDPQTGADLSAFPPTIVNEAGKLSGDLRAWSAGWSKNHFNQGSPKPDGTFPSLTAGPTGTYDKATGRYTLDWSSLIVSGAFNSFIGTWHLEGTFTTEVATPAPAETVMEPTVGGEPPGSDELLPILLVSAVGLVAVGGGGLTFIYSRRPRRR
ncbi:MAG: hypothetical protein ACE5KW_00975 [Dehalococcoidia bacterium]